MVRILRLRGGRSSQSQWQHVLVWAYRRIWPNDADAQYLEFRDFAGRISVGIFNWRYEMSAVNELTAVPTPPRTFAHIITNLVYRYGPIEDIHTRREHKFSLDHRQFTT